MTARILGFLVGAALALVAAAAVGAVYLEFHTWRGFAP
jgi:hypothetical protein